MTIKKKFPELSKFLDEMPIATDDSDPSSITFHDLNEYYESLEAVLIKYKLECPKK